MARHKQLMTRTTSTNKTTTKTKYCDKLGCLGDVSAFTSIFVFLCILYSFVLLFVVFGFERNFLPNLSANSQPNPPSTFVKRKYYLSSCKPFLPSWNLIYDYVVKRCTKEEKKIRKNITISCRDRRRALLVQSIWCSGLIVFLVTDPCKRPKTKASSLCSRSPLSHVVIRTHRLGPYYTFPKREAESYLIESLLYSITIMISLRQ